MLSYLINLSLPVLIYFISYLSIVFVQTFYRKKQSRIFRYLIVLIIVTIFLEFLYRRNNKSLVWLIVLSPLILLGILILVFLYILLFLRKKSSGEAEQMA